MRLALEPITQRAGVDIFFYGMRGVTSGGHLVLADLEPARLAFLRIWVTSDEMPPQGCSYSAYLMFHFAAQPPSCRITP